MLTNQSASLRTAFRGAALTLLLLMLAAFAAACSDRNPTANAHTDANGDSNADPAHPDSHTCAGAS